ncbi:MAG: pitrilysin family protein [Bacteroidales bacterium]
MKRRFNFLPAILLSLGFICFNSCSDSKEVLTLDYEKYTLENGLDVILHQDMSDPIVAVAIQYHVGSNREKPGKTGFAHLFEHMMFQESENVGQDQFFAKIQGAGGTLNGGTSPDGTVYYEVVPKNAAELILWMESDRMGYMINIVTRQAFANQQDVVLNEKRQLVDNNPYGHNNDVISKNLFPPDHPYNWQVIGEMEDLFNATIDDVKAFHQEFYLPNNATLVIAGDFESNEMKALVQKYFGKIPSGNKVTDLDPIPVVLEETKRLYHEDNFAKTPLLTMVWPTIEQYHPDAYALNFLARIMGSGKKAPMYKVLVKEKQLTSRVNVYNYSMELSGRFTISVPANSGTSLADAEEAVYEAFQKFEADGITETDLEKIKAGQETGFYNGISSVLGKSFQLARYNEYAGDPGYITKDIEKIKEVTIEDIQRVYETYIKDRPFVLTSFVPKGQLDLSAENCVKAQVVEESADNVFKVEEVAWEASEIERTPSSFDRTVEPVPGPDPVVTVPDIWESSFSNGMKVLGIEHRELPLVQYAIDIQGGHLLDPEEKSGVASLLATMLMEGTVNKNPEELEEAIDLLGARIRISAGLESITINASCLSRNLEQTTDLVREILLEPRWDQQEFEIAKMKVINNLKRNAANASYLSGQAFKNLLLGEESLLAIATSGTINTVEAITLEDLKAYYAANISPTVASLLIVGDVQPGDVRKAFSSITSTWEAREVIFPEFDVEAENQDSKIYFVDFPGAKQSVVRIGSRYKPEDYFEHYAVTVANYKLGGAFNGRLNMILREEKGFTYGARSDFSLNNTYGIFSASSSVRSDATVETMEIFRDEMAAYRTGISDADLAFTKDALLKSNARNYETLWALQGILRDINSFDLLSDYISVQQEILRSMTLEEHKTLCNKYIDPDRMVYVVVGDAATQMEPLRSLGFGEPELITVK